MSRTSRLLTVLVLGIAAVGCGGGRPEQVIEVKASNDPLYEPRSVLERYAQGQQLGSEVTSFPSMVEHVRKTDPGRADILEKGLADLQKAAPGARKAKAKELLAKIQPTMVPQAPGGGEPAEGEAGPADETP